MEREEGRLVVDRRTQAQQSWESYTVFIVKIFCLKYPRLRAEEIELKQKKKKKINPQTF